MKPLSAMLKNIAGLNGDSESPNLHMSEELVAGYNATRQPQLWSSVCQAPSINMVFTQSGEVKVCCHNSSYNLGTWPAQTIEEIWNSDSARQLRQHMQEYNLLHGCGVCDFDISRKSFANVAAKHFDTVPAHASFPTMMEFQFTNTCNLECVMCTGEFSSLIRKNREKLPALPNVYNSDFLLQVEKFIPYLKETRFSSSGEAFSIDMNYDLWDLIIQRNPQCLITIQTNGTVLTDRVKAMLAKGNFKIGVSLDSLQKETYEKIRINARFDKVMKNVEWFSQYMAGRNTFHLSMCVMRQNWHELPEYILFCNRINAAATLHKVWEPKRYSLDNLPAAELQEIHRQLSSFQLPESTVCEKQNKQRYLYFVSVIERWWQEAVEREKNMPDMNHLSQEELLLLVSERIGKYIDGRHIPAEEKSSLKETCLAKLKEMLLLIDAEKQHLLLTQIYFVNPAFMIVPLSRETAEELWAGAQKSMQRASFHQAK
ncbi:MAG: radical SAM protein [Bacteroidota bacterium]